MNNILQSESPPSEKKCSQKCSDWEDPKNEVFGISALFERQSSRGASRCCLNPNWDGFIKWGGPQKSDTPPKSNIDTKNDVVV